MTKNLLPILAEQLIVLPILFECLINFEQFKQNLNKY